MVTKRKPTKRTKNNADARQLGHPASAPVPTADETAKWSSLPVVDDPFDDESPFDGDDVDAGSDTSAENLLRSNSSHSSARAADETVNTADDTTDGAADDTTDDKRTTETRDVTRKRPTAAKKQHSLGVRIALGFMATVLIVLVVVGGLFSWNRWFRYDDATDFIGEWQIHGTEAIVLIDGENINLAADAAYSYTLDTKAKTIHFTMGTMEGGGRYRFSHDRAQLVIEDGEFGSLLGNAWHDFPWMVNELLHRYLDADLNDPSGENVSVLDRPGTSQ
ncbi:hypothetical protein [Adlercreutzia sp. ZJ138]|uniref:hypothetical protein n=1 Tax=Adlercreutzia sp. ZJ138 TaxID=2709405 RepID=UPI0013ECBBCD|nr:hypothetical protein [Adlercreutzia sp. ZJ138]